MERTDAQRTWIRLGLAAALCLAPLFAHAQWIWLDANGKHVFSDRAPPVDVPDKNIIRRPGGLYPLPPPAETAQAPKPAATASGPSELGKKVEAMKEADKAKEVELKQREEAARAENCRRAQRTKAAMESGKRVAVTTENGDQGIMSDDTRNTELQRANEYLNANCQ